MITVTVSRGTNTTPIFGLEKKLLLTAMRRGVAESAAALKLKLRLRTQEAQLGTRIGKAWQSAVYPGDQASGSGTAARLAYSPAAMVYSRATSVFLTHITGATILPRVRKYLAVPVKEIQDQWRSRGFTHRDGTMGPARGNSRNRGQYAAIDMRTWASRNNTTLRIAWNKKGGPIAGWAISNADNKIKFLLMRFVKLTSRLEVDSAFREVSASFPRKMQDEIRRILDGLNNR